MEILGFFIFFGLFAIGIKIFEETEGNDAGFPAFVLALIGTAIIAGLTGSI
jgi:hypothetical protein